MVTPRKSTGAPTARPRTDCLNTRTKCSISRSGCFIAASRVPNSLNTAFASAAGATPPSGGVWNAMPPIRIETSDSVCTRTPVASSDTSTPLAFQKRVLAVTYWS